MGALVVVGHNTSVGELGGALDQSRDDVGFGYPAGGVAVFVLRTAYAGVTPGTATLDGFTVPTG